MPNLTTINRVANGVLTKRLANVLDLEAAEMEEEGIAAAGAPRQHY